jgi:IclR family acetate operon transcriptional repressor
VISASAAIAAPGGRPIGSITVAAPFVRTGDEKVVEHGQAVKAAAESISQTFFGADPQVRPLMQSRRTG